MSAQRVTSVDNGRLKTLPELCEWLNLTERQVRNMVAKEIIPVTKISGRLFFDIVAIDRWLARSTTPGRAA
jgi:hypothetical protein